MPGLVAFLTICGLLLGSQGTPREPLSAQNSTRAFKPIQAGRGRTPDGFVFSFKIFQSEDKVWVRTTAEFRDSAADAKQGLKRRIQDAERVIEDVHGLKRAGEIRAVVEFSATKKIPKRFVIFWTHGTELRYIESPSLQHALEFEKGSKTAP